MVEKTHELPPLSPEEEVIVEEMAKAAFVEFSMGDHGVWWPPEEDKDHNPIHLWPDNVGTHIGVEGFRKCAKAAYEVVRQNMFTVVLEAESTYLAKKNSVLDSME